MKVLVTGASGFIGSHLVKALEERGDEVSIIKGQSLYRGDFVPSDYADIDYVFHLAAYGNMSNQKDEVMMFFSNLQGLFNFLFSTKDIPYKAFINVSSSSVLLPHETMYSATKAGAERLCKAFVDEYAKPIVTVRPFSVYGPGEADFRFIPTAFRSCLQNEPLTLSSNATHDWVYVTDIVNAMIELAIDAESQKGSAIGIGTGIATSNRDVLTMIERITGRKANVTEEKELRSFDNQDWKAQLSDYLCYTTFEQGLQKYYDSIK